MHRLLSLALVAAVAPLPLHAQPVVPDLATSLRCSAAFAIVTADQVRGIGTARTDYPELGMRGREFFVQVGARVMDEEKLDRPAMLERVRGAVEKLRGEIAAAPDGKAALREVMTPCMALLDASEAGRKR